MKKYLLFTLLFATLSSVAKSNVLWLKEPAISPDGETVAFTYKGDIFTVNSNGGKAHQITSKSSYEGTPLWTPDGKNIVFTSMRDGSEDIYIIGKEGGTARRLTTHSGSEIPLTFLNDSILLFSAFHYPESSSAVAPFLSQSYTVNVYQNNPRTYPYLSVAMRSADMNSDGKLLYTDKKGFENFYRKHERSSGTNDIWLVSPDNKFEKLTDFNGHDMNAVWSADGESFYYISEQSGTLNVHKRTLDGKDEQLTNFEKHPVRGLSASENNKLVFSWDGELYTLDADKNLKKVEVEIVTDDYDSDLVKGPRTRGASNIAVSPEGDEVAFVLRGDVYVTSTKYNTTRRITDTPAQERSLSFSPDGKKLVYDSDRDGKWQLFEAKLGKDEKNGFAYATVIEEEPLYSADGPSQQPVYSPDGKYVAFLENRTELKVIDVDSKKAVTALPGKYNYSYVDGDIGFTWSPDSKWLLVDYIGIGGWNNSDIALVSRDGKTVVDLTESGYSDNNPKWALDGKALVYSTGKYGMKAQGSWGNQSDAILMVLDGDAWDNFNMTEEEVDIKEQLEKKEKKEKEEKEKKEAEKDKKKDKKKKSDNKADKEKKSEKNVVIDANQFELKERKHRVRRLTTSSSRLGDYYLDKKGEKFYYINRSAEGKSNLYVRDLKKDEIKVLAKDVNGGIVPDKKGENLFVLSGNGMSKISLPSGEKKEIAFNAMYDRKPSKEREYIYDHMLAQVKDKFYDENLHGVDWEYYGEHYRKFLPYINNNKDFGNLLSEILGELNASHTGGGGRIGGADLSTGELGAMFDLSYKGDGLKIKEVLASGPLSKKSIGVKSGDIITAIDNEPIEADKDFYPLLEGKAGRKVLLTVKTTDGKEKNVTVIPANGISGLLYNRWIERNEAMVDSLSGGKIGYVHVQGMNTPSYQAVYDKLLGKYRNCDAVIVDTRYNGGGWLHNDIALLLSGKEYVRYTPRGQYIGSDPFSQWTKPSVMLVNESNYSDAHGTPYVYQTLGIGKVVGAPVPGTMTAVWWETQIDPSIYFGIPQVTSLDMNGKPLENKQLNPDVTVYNNPGDLINGRDAQLEEAVKVLMNK